MQHKQLLFALPAAFLSRCCWTCLHIFLVLKQPDPPQAQACICLAAQARSGGVSACMGTDQARASPLCLCSPLRRIKLQTSQHSGAIGTKSGLL